MVSRLVLPSGESGLVRAMVFLTLSELPVGEGGEEKMARASSAQLMELGYRIQRGQIPTWKIPAVFGIVEADPLGKYLRLVEEARKGAISAEQVQALIEGEDEELGIFKVTVDYDLSSEQIIIAGCYKWVHSSIEADCFSVSGEGEVEREFILAHLNKVVSTDVALAKLSCRGLRPAKIEELLALGASRPELQEKFPIVAPGSCFVLGYGPRDFVDLCFSGTGRILSFYSADKRNWGKDYRYLAVRKDAA
ncbi:hypothetical protein KKD80_01595 [Patescibacteria group bacterium]|nr:hypothetical protein [Patescibacteria group bacterium]